MRSTFLRQLSLFAWLLALAPSLAQAKTAHNRKAAKPVLTAPAAMAGELVPSDAPLAILFEDGQAGQGVIAMLGAASQASPTLAPKLVSQDLMRSLGSDPLSPPAGNGIDPKGPRAVVFDTRATGFSAPVADEARAKQLLQTWLSGLGPVRPTRGAPLKGPLASGGGDQVRAGMVAPVAGSLRLITASGRGAAALVSHLAHVGRKAQDVSPLGASATMTAALLSVPGPVRAWMRGEGPIAGTLLSINGSAAGLNARGLILPAAGSAALLEGNAPPESACAGMPLFCSRAAPGPALRALAPLFARELIGRDLLGPQRDALDAMIQNGLASSKGPVLLRIEGLNARSLSEPDSLLAALPSSISSGMAPGTALTLPAPLPAPWTALPAPQTGVLLSPQTQLCAQTQPGALWIAAPCSPLPAHLLEAGGAREIFARFDTKALAQSLRPLSALDALRGSLAAGAFAAHLLWGDLLARSGPIELTATPTTQTQSALLNALDLSFTWPLSLAATAK